MKLRDFFILAGSVAAASQVSALSLGSAEGQAILGAPLNVLLRVQPDAGQSISSSCVHAQVRIGEHPVASHQIHVTPESNAVRVRTTVPVNEPLVFLQMQAGCAATVSRSYALLADPPNLTTSTARPIERGDFSAKRLLTSQAAPSPLAAPQRIAKRAVSQRAIAAVWQEVDAANAEAVAPTQAHGDDDSALKSSVTEKPKLQLQAAASLDAIAPPPDTAAAAANDDMDDSDSAIASAQLQAQTRMEMDAATQRLSVVEQQLQQMQLELINDHDQLRQLQNQLTQAHHRNDSVQLWLFIVLGLLALAIAAIAWLLQRTRQSVQHVAAPTYSAPLPAKKHADAAVAGLAVAESLSPLASPDLAHASQASTDPAPAAPTSATAPVAKALTPATPKHSTDSSDHKLAQLADVLTSQALMDVCEQADFYASIGENDHAISLLQTHIDQQPASSPHAYLDLLQLLYQLGRAASFEQLRSQFHLHFNAQLPSFMGFERKGHDLGSAYPEVLAEIEALWPTEQVQQFLHGLIVRSPAGQHTASLYRFELAAFEELLLLYKLVRATTAAERGQLQNRQRTAPLQAPLPEMTLTMEQAPPTPPTPQPSFLGLAASEASAFSGLAADGATDSNDAPLEALNMQSPSFAQGGLNAFAGHRESPFQTASHFAPNEVLLEGLSLDWTEASAAAEQPPPLVQNCSDADTAADEQDASLDDMLHAWAAKEAATAVQLPTDKNATPSTRLGNPSPLNSED